jgi:hypothetical protein
MARNATSFDAERGRLAVARREQLRQQRRIDGMAEVVSGDELADAAALTDLARASGGGLGDMLRPHLPAALGQLVGQMKHRDPKVSQPALRIYMGLVQATAEDDGKVGMIYMTAFKTRPTFSLDESDGPQPCILCGHAPD